MIKTSDNFYYNFPKTSKLKAYKTQFPNSTFDYYLDYVKKFRSSKSYNVNDMFLVCSFYGSVRIGLYIDILENGIIEHRSAAFMIGFLGYPLVLESVDENN